MKIKLIYLIPLCAAVMLLNLVGQPAFAQDPEAVVEEDPAIVVGPSGRLDITFDQEGRGTRQLSGQGGSQTYNIRIPGNFQILPEESYLDLRFSHIPSIPDKPSRLDIAVRDGLIATVPITEGNAAVNTTRIPLPPGAINIGRNQMRFSLDTSGTCEDPGAVVNATIDGSSLVSFAYEQFAYPTDLSLYPFPFTEVSLLDIPTTLVLPDLPTSNDLSAAATLAAGLGQEAGTNINLNTITYAELTPEIRENNHLIAIGTPQTNLLISELDLPLDIDESIIQPGYGVLEEIV
ncbi:MAG: cellulose biosynthesis cyclic di-GMP-binding regulatory protein BcsB, partial [Chloroflexota bacterium]